MVLAHLTGNRAAVYGLRIPLSPEEALHRAAEQLVVRLTEDLAEHTVGEATETPPPPHRLPAVTSPAPGTEDRTDLDSPTTGTPAADPPLVPHSTPPGPSSQPRSGAPGDTGCR
jgi:hypothetical protein